MSQPWPRAERQLQVALLMVRKGHGCCICFSAAGCSCHLWFFSRAWGWMDTERSLRGGPYVWKCYMNKDALPWHSSKKHSSTVIFNPRKFVSLELVFQEEQNFTFWLDDPICKQDNVVLSNSENIWFVCIQTLHNHIAWRNNASLLLYVLRWCYSWNILGPNLGWYFLHSYVHNEDVLKKPITIGLDL